MREAFSPTHTGYDIDLSQSLLQDLDTGAEEEKDQGGTKASTSSSKHFSFSLTEDDTLPKPQSTPTGTSQSPEPRAGDAEASPPMRGNAAPTKLVIPPLESGPQALPPASPTSISSTELQEGMQ